MRHGAPHAIHRSGWLKQGPTGWFSLPSRFIDLAVSPIDKYNFFAICDALKSLALAAYCNARPFTRKLRYKSKMKLLEHQASPTLKIWSISGESQNLRTLYCGLMHPLMQRRSVHCARNHCTCSQNNFKLISKGTGKCLTK